MSNVETEIGARRQSGEYKRRRPSAWRATAPSEVALPVALDTRHAGHGRGCGVARWAMWQVYMAAPWTRDGTVRAYVVTMAPEVAGRIVKLPVADNQFVHKGDVLFEIDPADYRIALEQAQAQTQRDGATLDYARKNEKRKAASHERWLGVDGRLPANDEHVCINPKGPSPWTMPPSPRRSSISAGPLFARR